MNFNNGFENTPQYYDMFIKDDIKIQNRLTQVNVELSLKTINYVNNRLKIKER